MIKIYFKKLLLALAVLAVVGGLAICVFSWVATRQFLVKKQHSGGAQISSKVEVTENWKYLETPDKMGRGPIKQALTVSLNTVSFGFPYQGEQHGTLILRSHPKLGNDVILSIEKGQFLTGIDGCEVNVRFDDDKPIVFGGSEPSDYTTTMIFISGYSKFVARLLRAKKVMIEAPFYQEGNQVFEFKVDSLKWSQPTPGLTEKKIKEREKALKDSFDANPYYHPH